MYKSFGVFTRCRYLVRDQKLLDINTTAAKAFIMYNCMLQPWRHYTTNKTTICKNQLHATTSVTLHRKTQKVCRSQSSGLWGRVNWYSDRKLRSDWLPPHTQWHIPQDLNIYHYRCDKPKLSNNIQAYVRAHILKRLSFIRDTPVHLSEEREWWTNSGYHSVLKEAQISKT